MSDGPTIVGRRILMVETDPLVGGPIIDGLSRAGASVGALDSDQALLASARADPPDLALIDLRLPGRSGFDTLVALRQIGDIPAILLAGGGDEFDEVRGLETGADAFLRVPVAVRVLVAHVISVLRRQARATTAAADHLPGFLADHGWQFDATRRRLVGPNEQAIALTATEVRILDTLAAYPDRALDRTSLSARALGRELTDRSRTMDMLVSRLRKKLRGTATSARTLQVTAAYGKGYRLSWAVPADC